MKVQVPDNAHQRASTKLVASRVMPVARERNSDCEWLVGRYKSHLLNNDRSSAKAWILTARSLFPDDFQVQVCYGAH